MGSEVLVTGTRAASELDDEALAHEVGTILNQLGRMFGFLYTRSYVRNAVYRLACVQWIGAWLKLTRDNITSVHCVLVLDEAKSVHELDLSDLTSAMRLEVALDICLGGIARKVA